MRLLDLFCCEGGASRGYALAGFDVYGVDLFIDYRQSRYPFASLKMDALEVLRRLIAGDSDGVWLSLKRHRLFESQVLLYPPSPCRHGLHPTAGVYGHGGQHKRRVYGGVYGGARNTREGAKERAGGYVPKDKAVRAALLGLNPDEHTNAGLAQSIPPAYTEHIGRQLIDHVRSAAA